MAQLFISTDGINYEPFGAVGALSFDNDNIVIEPNETNESNGSAYKKLTSIMKTPIEANFEIDVSYLNKFKILELFTGKKITNNYLKLHGITIQRHSTLNRLRKRKNSKYRGNITYKRKELK